MIDLAQQIATQNCPINFYQLQHLQTATIKTLQMNTTTVQVKYLQSIMDAISQKNALFTKNFIFVFQNTQYPIVKIHIAKILNEKIFNFWQIWRKQNQSQIDEIFNLVVNNIVCYLQPHENKQLFQDKIVLQLNKSLKIIYRHEWKNKLNGVLQAICDPRENPQLRLKNNLKVVRLIFEDAIDTSTFLLSNQRFQFMENIKYSAQSILASIFFILAQLNKYKEVLREVVMLLPYVLSFIDCNLFLSNYSALTDYLIILYGDCKQSDIEIKTNILESLKIIMGFPTDKILYNLIAKIDRKFVININSLLEFEVKNMKLTKIKQKNNTKTNKYSNSGITSPRKTLSFFDQQKKTNNQYIEEIVQNFYCNQEVTQTDQHVLQVIQAFLITGRKIQVKVTNETATEADRSEKSNLEVLKKLIQNLVKFQFWIALKLQNQDSAQDLINTQRQKLFLLDIIKLTLLFVNINGIFLPVKAKLEMCSMLICNLSICPSYFWHSYTVPKVKILSEVKVEDQSNFYQIIDSIEDIFPIVWKYLSPQFDLILNFVVEKLDYYLKLASENQDKKRPDRILGINRLVWGVKHLMDSSSGYLKIADKVHYKLQMQTDSKQSNAITKFATKFCWPFISNNQEQQKATIQRLFKELDSQDTYAVEFYSLLMRQVMQKVFSVSQEEISIFLDRFENLIFYQDKNERNLVLLPCLLQFLKKMENPDFQQLQIFCQRIIKICVGQERQYPQRKGFIKIQCLTWIIKQFFTFLDQADQMLQDENLNQNQNSKKPYQPNNKQWTNLVCCIITKGIEPYVLKIFQQLKEIQYQVFLKLNSHDTVDKFLKCDQYIKYDLFIESFIDFVVAYSRTWKTNFRMKLSQNNNESASDVIQQLIIQQGILIQIIVHTANMLKQYNLDILNPKLFKLFAMFLQFYCDVLVINPDLYLCYKNRVNQVILQVYNVTNSKIKAQTNTDFALRISYYQFFERVLTNQNIFYVLSSQTVNLAISDILIKICLDDQIQVVQTGVFILQKLFSKIMGNFQSNKYYEQIWNCIVPITSAVFNIMLITPGKLYFQEISTLLLHLFQIICRSNRKLFAHSKCSNWQNMMLILQNMLRKEYFADQECLSQDIKNLVRCTFSQQQIILFRQKLKDLLIMTKMRITRAKLDMEDTYQ